MGAFINYVDVFLDLFVPLFPLYRIEVALINKIAHGDLLPSSLLKNLTPSNVSMEKIYGKKSSKAT